VFRQSHLAEGICQVRESIEITSVEITAILQLGFFFQWLNNFSTRLSINVHGYTVNGNHEELFAIIDSLRNAP